jgi:DNA polymerase-1
VDTTQYAVTTGRYTLNLNGGLMANVLCFDLETENYRYNKRLASPFDPRNYIVQIGWSINGGECFEKYYEENHRENVMPCLDDIDVIVGFNIKFDLLWVWKEPTVIAFLKRGGTIYCGQYVEYLLGGMTQDVQMTSMNEIAESYGGGCKLDAVKELWEEGYLTSMIPRNMLTDYLVGDGGEIVGDVQNTWLIYVGQIQRVLNDFPPAFREMIKLRMDGLLATIEMEYNGIHIDEEVGEELRTQLVADLLEASNTLNAFIPELPPELVFNWGSPAHKSCLIFGGVLKYGKWLAHTDVHGNVQYAQKAEAWPLFTYSGTQLPVDPKEVIQAGTLYVMEVPQGTFGAFTVKDKHYIAQDSYKSGKRSGEGKFKNVKVDNYDKPKGAIADHYFKFDGYTTGNPKWISSNTDAYGGPLYSTAETVIQELATRGLAFTDALSARTSLAKDLSTYYWVEDAKGKRKGMLDLVDEYNIIHHNLNHVKTVTSRLSSSDPNVQTIPRGTTSNVKKMFTSRFENGKVAEIDYSQLEIVVQAVLTRDPQLMDDLKHGVDFHVKRLSQKLGRDYQELWDLHHIHEDPEIGAERTIAKFFSFQRAYGAGASAISNDLGVPKAEIEALIAAEEAMYPQVVRFDEKLEQTILTNKRSSGRMIFINGVAFKQNESHWDSPTGTRYMWREGETPEFLHKHGKYVGFSPTERKNYPVQGDGGFIVQAMLGKVFRYFVANDMFNGDVLLINTVHDCAWLDGKDGVIQTVTKSVQAILESVPEVFNATFPEVQIEVPFPCESEIGEDLFTMHSL